MQWRSADSADDGEHLKYASLCYSKHGNGSTVLPCESTALTKEVKWRILADDKLKLQKLILKLIYSNFDK